MKKIAFFLVITCGIFLAGCFESTEDITINKEGGGVFTNTIDLSKMVGLLKQMGNEDAKKLKNTDTTISLAGLTDSISGFTADQKKIVDKGTMRLTLNMDDEKLLFKLNIPFQKVSDIALLQQVLPKISEAAMKRMPGTDQMPSTGNDDSTSALKSFDDFYDVTYSDKLITKTLNKTKYDAAKDGEYMKALQQVSDMGSPVVANYVINLPRPAKKVEGKGAKLSDDKMKVSLSATSDDFFSDPSKFEYRIEY